MSTTKNYRAQIAEMYVSLFIHETALEKTNRYWELVTEVTENLTENFQYKGVYQQHAITAYQRYAKGLPLNALVSLMQVAEEQPFLSFKPSYLCLKEILQVLTPEHIEQLKKATSRTELDYHARQIYREIRKSGEAILGVHEWALGVRVQDFAKYGLDLSMRKLKAHVQFKRELFVQGVEWQLMGQAQTQFYPFYVKEIREQTKELLAQTAIEHADKVEVEIQKALIRLSIPKIEESYPRIQEMVDLSEALANAFEEYPKQREVYYKVGMPWEDYRATLTEHYKTEGYAFLISKMRSTTFRSYQKVIGIRAKMMAKSTVSAASDTLGFMKRKLMMITPLAVIVNATNAVLDTSDRVIEGVYEHVIKRGFRTIEAVAELVESEVDKQVAKRRGLQDEEVKDLLRLNIIEEIMMSGKFNGWVDQVNKDNIEELYQVILERTQVTCDEAEKNGLEWLLDRSLDAQVAQMKELLTNELTQFGQEIGFEFIYPPLLDDFESRIRHHYRDVLRNPRIVEDEKAVEVLLQVGYRAANNHIRLTLMSDTERDIIAQEITEVYQEAEKQSIHYKVPEEELYIHLGGDAYFVQLKQTFPLEKYMEEKLYKHYQDHLRQVIKALPVNEQLSAEQLNHKKAQLQAFLHRAKQGILEIDLFNGETVFFSQKLEVYRLFMPEKSPAELQRLLEQEDESALGNAHLQETRIRGVHIQELKAVEIPFEQIKQVEILQEELSVGLFEKLFQKVFTTYCPRYKKQIEEQGFRLHDAFQSEETVYKYVLKYLATQQVTVDYVEEFVEVAIQETFKQGIKHVFMTADNEKEVLTQTGRVMQELNVTDAQKQIEISAIVKNIPSETFCKVKVLFNPEATQQNFYLVIKQTIEEHGTLKDLKGKARYDQANYLVRQALSKITEYTTQDRENYTQLLRYAQALQNRYNEKNLGSTIQLRVNEQHQLIEVSLDNHTEVFLFHPQFIMNAISHTVYVDRTGVLNFSNSFKSEFDVYLENDIEQLAKLISARRRTDIERKPLTENDERRMHRLFQLLKMYNKELREFGVSLVAYKENNQLYRFHVVVNGKELYAFNPNYLIEIPTKRIVYQRTNVDAPLAELQEQFLHQSHTPFLTQQQMSAFRTLIELAFDLRKSMPETN